jgi:hypothetical protein
MSDEDKKSDRDHTIELIAQVALALATHLKDEDIKRLEDFFNLLLEEDEDE